MNAAAEQRALGASTVALVVALGCIALFLPPLLEATVSSVLRSTATALALSCALLLHWVFLGLAARRMERSAVAWVGLSVLLFPVGSAAALILLSWLGDERTETAAAA
jgi:protein-S-isoprenylcysteine O-methyltransferase Ste14